MIVVTPVLSGWNEIASWLKVHPQTAMGWERDAELPIARINGYVLTTTGLLERWVIKNLNTQRRLKKKKI